MALATPPVSDRKRVKVYELRENDWYDRGTGFCAGQIINEEARIYVESEDELERTLLETKIKKDDGYQKQQDTLIVWTEPNGIDMALSFQEAEGCGAIWNFVSENAQKQSALAGQDDGISEDAMDSFNPLPLPTPTLGNLDDVESMIRGATQTPAGRDALPKFIISDNYVEKLLPLVEAAEDLEDLGALHRLCNIMKTLVLLNDSTIIEYVVRDEVILGVVGALEYDPDFPNHKANHRQYLSDSSKFKEVVRIQDPDIRRKIHFTYRLQYLKDVVLARILDDPTFSVLNSLIFFHQVDIVQHIQSNPEFLKELFAILSSPDTDVARQKDAVSLIQQSCAIAKSIQPPARAQLYQQLIAGGLFSTITFALQHPDASVRVAGNDILVAVIDHDASIIRTHIFKAMNENVKPLTDTLIELLLVETDLGVKAQIADAIKVLLDPTANNMAAEPIGRPPNEYLAKMRAATSASRMDEFLHSFYDQSVEKLFKPLKDLDKRESFSNLSIHEVALYSHLIEILCFFIRLHNYRSKSFSLTENFAVRIAKLMTSPEKHLKLTALKYFRTCIGLQDEYLIRQMIGDRLFEPILNMLYETMPRDNLLNSACLELFEFVKRESIKPIINHLVESYRDKLQGIPSVNTFHGIINHYDQAQNGQTDVAETSFMTSDTDTPNRNVVNGGRWHGLRESDAEEEAYFMADDNEDDEDELAGPLIPTGKPMPNGISSPSSKPLVNYPDDDDGGLPAEPLSTSPTSSAPDANTSSSPPSSIPPLSPHPPERLAEKRRREEYDDEDELGKLSNSGSANKRRSSGNSMASISSTTGNKAQLNEDDTVPEEEHSLDKDPSKDSSPGHQLRKKTSFGRNNAVGTANKKIAIALGGGGKKDG